MNQLNSESQVTSEQTKATETPFSFPVLLFWPYPLHCNLLWLQLGVFLISGITKGSGPPIQNSNGIKGHQLTAQLPTFQVASPERKYFLAKTLEQ